MNKVLTVERHQLEELLSDYTGSSTSELTDEDLLNGRKPKGFWKEQNNVVAFAEAVKRKHGFNNLPGPKTLSELGYSSLLFAVTKYHGDMFDFRVLLGEDPARRKNGAHTTLRETLNDIMGLIDEKGLDRLPNAGLLVSWGYSKLTKDINHHGGFGKVRRELGEKVIRKDQGQWKDKKFTIKEAKRVMKEQSYKSLPGTKALQAIGESSLGASIAKYHGGMRTFRTDLGQEQKERPKGKSGLCGFSSKGNNGTTWIKNITWSG